MLCCHFSSSASSVHWCIILAVFLHTISLNRKCVLGTQKQGLLLVEHSLWGGIGKQTGRSIFTGMEWVLFIGGQLVVEGCQSLHLNAEPYHCYDYSTANGSHALKYASEEVRKKRNVSFIVLDVWTMYEEACRQFSARCTWQETCGSVGWRQGLSPAHNAGKYWISAWNQ